MTFGAECPIEDCHQPVRIGQLLCRPHWLEVPWELQREVYRTWRAYQRAARDSTDDFEERRAEYDTARAAAIGAVS